METIREVTVPRDISRFCSPIMDLLLRFQNLFREQKYSTATLCHSDKTRRFGGTRMSSTSKVNWREERKYLAVYYCFLTWLKFWPCEWRRYIPPKILRLSEIQDVRNRSLPWELQIVYTSCGLYFPQQNGLKQNETWACVTGRLERVPSMLRPLIPFIPPDPRFSSASSEWRMQPRSSTPLRPFRSCA
jgi:hypothetical protein